ncbi:MAG: hypothetical protein HYX56_02420 [Chloroflexi bacterium]|nr:hypothetical protein [Chloroflexota bacterium]
MTDPARVPLARWIVRGALLFALAFANLNDIWSPDVVPNTLMVWSLIREHDVDFDEFVAVPDRPLRTPPLAVSPEIPRDSYFFRACGLPRGSVTYPASFPRSPGGPPPPGPGDQVCSIFPPGISLLALPILAPFVLLDPGASDGALLIRAGHAAAALIETIAALLLWSVVRRFTSARWALTLVLLYWLATSVRTVSSQALWQHAGVHLSLAVGLWLVLHERAVSWRREILGGLALGFGIVVRQTTAIAALGISGGGHRRLGWPIVSPERWRSSLVFLGGVGLGAIPLLVYDQVAFGSPFEQGYGSKPFDGTALSGLYGLLLSPSRGLLIYEPWVVAGLAALALAWRRSGHVAERLRTISLAWLVLLFAYAAYAEWWGGRVFGPRFLDDLAPALVVALAWGIGQGILSRTWARLAFAAGAAWSLLLFNAAALVYDPNGWDTVPTNVNFEPARLLVWSDPQWLAVLRSLASADLRTVAAAALSAAVITLLLRMEILAGKCCKTVD